MGIEISKAYEIKDAKIKFVSLVNKAANKHKFLIAKADGDSVEFEASGEILKADRQTHYVTGIVYEPMKEDTQGDFMTAEEIEKAQRTHAKSGNAIDLQHNGEKLGNVTVVESYIAKSDEELDGHTITKGTWVMTVEVPEGAIWDAIEKQEITGFSMGGHGRRDPVSKDISKEDGETVGLIKSIAKRLGIIPVEKTGKMGGSEIEKLRNINNTLTELIKSYESGVQKEETMTEEQIREIVRSELANSKKAETAEEEAKAAAPESVTKAEEPTVSEEIMKAVSEAIEEKIKPVSEAVESLRKERGVPSNLNDTVEKSSNDEHYLHGLI